MQGIVDLIVDLIGWGFTIVVIFVVCCYCASGEENTSARGSTSRRKPVYVPPPKKEPIDVPEGQVSVNIENIENIEQFIVTSGEIPKKKVKEPPKVEISYGHEACRKCGREVRFYGTCKYCGTDNSIV